MDDDATGIDELDAGNATNPFAPSGRTAIDPETIGTDSGNSGTDSSTPGSTGNTGKKRGRKPGSKNGTKAAAVSKSDISGLENILFSVHLAISAIAKTPELALDQAEARELAKAAVAVQAHYETVIDPKILAWGQLIVVMGGVYGPRAFAIKMRLDNEKSAKRVKSNVVQGNFPDTGFTA